MIDKNKKVKGIRNVKIDIQEQNNCFGKILVLIQERYRHFN